MNLAVDQEAIAYLKNLAANLGIPDANVGSFVADELRKERREIADKERNRIEFEDRKTRQLALEKAEHEAKLVREETLFKQRLLLDAEESKARTRALRRTDRTSDRGGISDGSDDDDDDDHFSSFTWKPSLPKFDDENNDCIDGYLKRFERLASTYKWKKSDWATILATRLTGRAVEVYNSLTDAHASDYDRLKTELLARYQLTSETYRRRFREYKKKDSETYTQMGARLSHNLDKWFELSKCSDLREMFLLEQFLQTLDPELAFEIRCRSITTLSEAATEAQHLHEARQSVFGECRDDSSSSDDSSKGEQKQKPRLVKKCYFCKSSKHLIKDCVEYQKDEPLSSGAVKSESVNMKSADVPKLCAPCNEKIYDPTCIVTVNDKKVKGLRDTGSHVCVIRKDLVNESQLNDCHVSLAMADKSIIHEFPVAVVDISSPFYVGQVEAAVMETPIADFIVGNYSRMDGKGENLPVHEKQSVVGETTTSTETETEKGKSRLCDQDSGLLGIGVKQLKNLQREDDTLLSCHESAKLKQVKNVGDSCKVTFAYKNGVLKRLFTKNGATYSQTVVPKSLRNELLQSCHENRHDGVKKTRQRIWKKFFWPSMCVEIRNFVNSCEQCRRDRGSTCKSDQESKVKTQPDVSTGTSSLRSCENSTTVEIDSLAKTNFGCVSSNDKGICVPAMNIAAVASGEYFVDTSSLNSSQNCDSETCDLVKNSETLDSNSLHTDVCDSTVKSGSHVNGGKCFAVLQTVENFHNFLGVQLHRSGEDNFCQLRGLLTDLKTLCSCNSRERLQWLQFFDSLLCRRERLS